MQLTVILNKQSHYHIIITSSRSAMVPLSVPGTAWCQLAFLKSGTLSLSQEGCPAEAGG